MPGGVVDDHDGTPAEGLTVTVFVRKRIAEEETWQALGELAARLTDDGVLAKA